MKVLLAGWIGGGAIIVLMSLPYETVVAKPRKDVPKRERVAAQTAVAEQKVVGGSGLWVPGAVSPEPKRSLNSQPTTHNIIVPVQGIDPAALHDNFDQVRGGGRIHHALDIMAPRGTPVVAAVDGKVRKLFNSRAGGLTVYQYDVAEARVYYYAHLDRYADGLAEGQFIAQGTVIGYVGTTGNSAPDAPHLHFSIETLPPTKEWWKGTPVNPYPLLTTRASVLP